MRGEPSRLVATTIGKLQGDSDSEMTPFLRFSSTNSLIFSRSAGEYLRWGILIGGFEPVSIVKGWSFAGIPTGRERFEQFFFSHLSVRFLKYHNFSRACSAFPLFNNAGSFRSSNSSNLSISIGSGGWGRCLGTLSRSRACWDEDGADVLASGGD